MLSAEQPVVGLPQSTWPRQEGGVSQQRQRIVDSWKPSDRRRQGHLSFKAYEQAGIQCPTDLWSYQRLFIEQRRDAGNLLAGPSARPGLTIKN